MIVSPHYYSDFTVKWATLDWEQEQAFALRRRVFCQEQQLFIDSDRDDIDDKAQTIVAIANQGGWHERIVGTVRIHQLEPDIWLGSRLAVEQQFRHQRRLGATLIKLAVSSARGVGCKEFYGQVQKQNEALFQKLHWRSESEIMIRGLAHVIMQAELEQYPPCYQPGSGYVICGEAPYYNQDIISPLLALPSKITAPGAAHAIS